MEILGSDLGDPIPDIESREQCQGKCQGDSACLLFTWKDDSETCQLKSALGTAVNTIGD